MSKGNTFIEYLKEKVQVKPDQLGLIPKHTTYQSIKKGKSILKAGEVCNHIYFVERGVLRLFSIDKNGKEHNIQFATENWFITERTSLYFGEPSSYYIDSLEDSEVAIFDLEFLKNLSALSPEFRKHNEYILQNHVRHLQNRVNLLIGATAEERYLDFIKLYPELMLRIPQWMTASYLGITPESLSRVRKQLAIRAPK